MAEDTIVAPGVVRNPERRSGRPTIQCTRVAVEQVINLLAQGETIESAAHQYHITPDQVRDALRYAEQLVHALVAEPSDEELDQLAEQKHANDPHLSEVAE